LTTPKTPVATKVDPETADKIERAAEEVGMTTSRFVACVLEIYVDQNPARLEALYPEDPLESFEAFTRTYL
jgi:antitoxin component of RelBE/YafQ-DinJ toxin-antitoxin module